MRGAWVRTALMATLVALAAGTWVAPAGAAGVTKQALRFDVLVGPNRDQPCTVDADFYLPAGASKAAPVPAVLATNGFGGSKAEFADLAASYARRGYAFLSYSGLGFGASGCKITLDDRDHDGAAGSQLISFLGGSKAATNGTRTDAIKLDGAGDPRVGMIGGSYGGQIQFAVAAVDRRLDTIIPQITWNDLSYSLSPNNTDLVRGVTYGTPGVVKVDWPVLFFGLGAGQGLAATLKDPSHAGPCPNFADQVCPALILGAAKGYLDGDGVGLLRSASVSSYYSAIKIPTFITQGQSDNLFDLQEAVTTYTALKAQGLAVKMLWRSSGHSGGDIGRSENDPTNPEAAYESRMDLAWFDHYLKGSGPAPANDFSFLTDWLPYAAGKDAAPAVGTAPAYPAAAGEPLFLSGADALVATRGEVKRGSATMTSVTGAPTSTGGGFVPAPGSDPPGTSVSYTTPPLKENLDLAGVPSVTFKVDAPTFAPAPDPAAKLVLFAKLYDVAPDGKATLNRNLISAARVGDPTRPVTIELPGLVHRYAKGHVLRLTLSTSAATYRSSYGAGPVTISTDPASPGVLTIPHVGAQTGPVGTGPDGTTPFGTTATPVGTKPSTHGKRVRPAARLPRHRSCASPRRLRFRLRVPGRLRVARVAVNGRHVKTVRGRKLRKRVAVRLPHGRARVVVTARAKSGARRRSARTYRRCR